ncbi:uncharacterized protein EDB91DRAFT_1243577 [Suillus paluster]|uniref:uncharacterized protein n=1 Tax=Suillus paluster TaxID=48578 RepID=UPI001B86C7D4|nr:uncharacterized protein EDB91DRAFT_1243577 [Suillus paluster]KAG1751307.1 hypothetical protein EDB91DRAFT_1243577 [Suillus paluster]
MRHNHDPSSSPADPLTRFNETWHYADIPSGTAAIRDEHSGHHKGHHQEMICRLQPAYYTHITPSAFNFSPTVHAYLQEIKATPEVMLRIDASLNYSVDDWEYFFVDAGLSTSQARNLRQQQVRKTNLNEHEVGDARSAYMVSIADLAEKYHTSLEWMSKQFFLGGKLLKSSHKISMFNVVVRHEIARRKENGITNGRKTLAIVSRELKESREWKNLTQEEEDELMEDIQVENTSKAPVKIYTKDVATEITKTMGNLDPEALKNCTGCNVFWGLTRNTSNDNFGPRSYASDPIKNACLALFKLMPEQMVVNIDAYIADMIRTGMEEVLSKWGISATKMPQVAYHNHERFVCAWGIELVGWTEGAIINPGEITSSVTLRRLHGAIKDSLCYWHELTDDELAVRKEAYEQRVISGEEQPKATHSDKGKRKRSRPAPSVSAKSKSIVPDSDNENEDDTNCPSTNNSPTTISTLSDTTPPLPAMNRASPLSNSNHNVPRCFPAFTEA